MALTELNTPTKAEVYRNVQDVAGEIKSRGLRWNEMSEFIQSLTVTDLDALGIPAGPVRTDLNNFRTALDAIVAVIESNETVLDVLRRMLII